MLSFTRSEWSLERGRITRQRRYPNRVTVKAALIALELSEHKDQGGDFWSLLRGQCQSAHGAKHVVIVRALYDSWEARALGRWLAQHTAVSIAETTSSKL